MNTMVNTVGLSLQDYVSVIRRRRFAMSWMFLGSLAIIIAIIGFIPERYRSAASIYIESPEVRTDLMRTTVQVSSTDLRIDRIRDKVISNKNLQPIIEELSLYPDLDPQDRPSAMRKSIDTPRILDTKNGVNNARNQLRGGDTIGFEVAFRHESPEIAAKVASKLAQAFIKENTANRAETVKNTSDFLGVQAEELKTELARTEQALAEFKRVNAGTLPTDRELNQQMLDRSQRDLDSVEREMRTLQERKNILVAQLNRTPTSLTLYSEKGEPILGSDQQLEKLRREYISMASRYSPDHPDVVKLRKEIALLQKDTTSGVPGSEDLQLEIDAKQAELDGLHKRYAPDHPDIKRLEKEVALLQEQLKDAPKTSGRRAPVQAPNNPDYLALQVQISGADTELAALREERDDYRDKVRDYERRINRAPETERELLTLTRDYEIAGHDYDEIRQKQAEAERAVVIEDEQRAERYVLQADAFLPDAPAQPTHITLLMAGIFLGLTVSFGTALLMEGFDHTVRGARDIRTMLAAPPIAVVPMIENDSDVRHRVLRRATLLASFVAVAVLAVLTLA